MLGPTKGRHRDCLSGKLGMSRSLLVRTCAGNVVIRLCCGYRVFPLSAVEINSYLEKNRIGIDKGRLSLKKLF